MIPKYLWLVFLVGLLLIGHIQSQHCTSENASFRRVTRENMRLLSNLSNSFPLQCLSDINDFRLPQNVLSNSQLAERGIKEVAYEISIQVFSVFSRHTSDSIWNEEFLTQIQSGLSEQTEYLKQCLEEEENENEEMTTHETEHPGAQVIQQSKLALRSYFQRIENYLRDKKYYYCAWKIVEVEIKRCFSYFLKFIELLRGN
ncbi:PREDICTED: interferon kappa [Chinchilla lanigera]|uniref:interferon kappa n=1 Tax=Chinchilla lanigera TaxID=34839 RepID=UPI0006963B73|nr:PREDICTED: interferon kappa [Chinchilla lanigera]